MKLADAVSLREMLERYGPLSPEAALVVLKEALLELAASHRRGVVHRDCAPENVFIDTAGSSKLSDFGAAIGWDGQTPAGTPLYQAPEQWQGAPESPAADIYAAAVVFFECLTGEPPFSGDVFDLREQHIAEPVPLGLVHPPLGRLIAWGAAKNPADRPRSAITFVSQLESVAVASYGPDWAQYGHRDLAERAAALLSGHDGSPGPAYPPDPADSGSKRRLAVIAGVAAVAVAALGATAAAVTLQGKGHQAAVSGLPNQEAAAAPTPASQTLTRPGTAPDGLATWAKTPSPGSARTSQAASLTTSPAPSGSAAAPGQPGSPTDSGPSATSGPPASRGPSRPSRPARPGSPSVSSSPTPSSASPAPSQSATASSPAQALSVAGCGGQATFAATDSFSCPFTASGGLAPYNWSVTGLPDGLQTSDSGTSFTLETVPGDPVQRGTFTVTVTVQDSEAQNAPVTATATMTLVVTRAS